MYKYNKFLIPLEYMTNIELSKGSIQFDENVYFRHQLFIFLTKVVTNKPEEPF